MAEQKQLNIYQKLQKTRYELSKKEIKKSGKAIGKDGKVRYEYFELNDFMPYITELCFENGLTTKFNFNLETATLEVIDSDDPEVKEIFEMPVKVSAIMMCNEMQNIGGAKTFSKRYLYSDAFEISESEIIDSSEPNIEAIEGNKKIDKAAVFVIKKLLDETKSDEGKFLNCLGVKKIEDIPNSSLNVCMNELNKRKATMQKKSENNKPKVERQEENLIPNEIDF
ncbi:ERF family protein [Clostridium neonatale]|uniref:ERF superfamily protein n=2 Tax=Clostridium neonatale TaxID=137838 RepID=A0AA86MF35_9CLOT|nr:ERF family protein [Clostridium neonatale]MBP8313262.1 ERF family protein [Clostridium neonatale]CAG9705477.1 ERF superfamily protein [Clostridium neonatale]CAI3558245.1 ERF superfamily protein [Clostridium neonatale]CAI3572644.1 ERF superfamily protein [Clostridium neonatale]CAI3592738.1 ERF superfamily protein [Clostridium neonatale]